MKYIRSNFKLNIDKSENKSSEETKKRSSDSSENSSLGNELSKDNKIVHENSSIEHREDSILSIQSTDSSDDNLYNEIMLRLSIKKDKKCLWTPLEEEYLNDEINSKDFNQKDMNEIAIDYNDIEDKSKLIPFKKFMKFIEKRQRIYEYKIVDMVHGCIRAIHYRLKLILSRNLNIK